MHIPHETNPAASNGSSNGSSNDVSANGTTTNGASSKGGSNGYTNGEARRHANGDGGEQTQRYHGHDKQEMVRLIMQALQGMGYGGAAATLEAESGVELESPSVAALRYAVLDGEWNDAEMLLLGSRPQSASSALDMTEQGLPLKAGVDRNELRLALRRQKYLELLEQRDHGRALTVLRHGLTPLRPPVAILHNLSGLMVCPTIDELKKQARWDGALGGSRKQLLDYLSQAIHHSVIVPPSRLADLLTQTQRGWIRGCIWHNPIDPISLFVDHRCDKETFPLNSIQTITQNDEIYHVSFSNNGRYLAASGKEKIAFVYEVGGDWEVKYRLADHADQVGYVAFSPDDSLLVTCSCDHSAKLWDMTNGSCVATLSQFVEPVTSVAWLPDGSGFITGTLDSRNPLMLWRVSDILRKSTKPSVVFPAKNFRVQDLAVTPDGHKALAISADHSKGHLSVFDLQGLDYDEIFRLRFEAGITCINVSRDGRHALLNLTDNKLQSVEIDTMELVQHYPGQRQGSCVIRSTYGGADENLVISGSEDGLIYVFHRDTATPIETLPGHVDALNEDKCVNAVAWNPADLCMFASCGDDGKIKIWSKGAAYTPPTTRRTSSDISITNDGIDTMRMSQR